MKLKYETLIFNSSAGGGGGGGLQNQFYEHSVDYFASSFLFNLENQEGFDRDLIFDKNSLLSVISPDDVDAVVRLCPYFAVEEERIGLELFVRKAIVYKGLKSAGGRIGAFLRYCLQYVARVDRKIDGTERILPKFSFRSEQNM